MQDCVLIAIKKLCKENFCEHGRIFGSQGVFNQRKIENFGWLDDTCNEYNWRDGAVRVLANKAEALADSTINHGYVDRKGLAEINGIVALLEVIAE